MGNDFRETRRIANDVVRTLSAIPGAEDVIIDQEPPLPQLKVDVDRLAAAVWVSMLRMMSLIQTGIGGAPVTQVFIDERSYNIAARFKTP
jgi:cobalt-zinc-cadmium resistance protein CzcA